MIAVCVVALVLLVWLFRSSKDSSGGEGGPAVAQSDAEHLATMLVKEICIYHEDKLVRGRREKNILAVLQDEIARVRVLYRQRAGFPREGERDYFYEALVKILAQGDESALGEHSDVFFTPVKPSRR